MFITKSAALSTLLLDKFFPFEKLEKKEKTHLVVLLILLMALSFALGYIFAERFLQSPIIIEKRDGP